jgi:hypothetical protein
VQIATCACTSQLFESPQDSLPHQEHRTSKQPKLRSRRHHRPHFSRRPPHASTVQSYPARPEDLLVLGVPVPPLDLVGLVFVRNLPKSGWTPPSIRPSTSSDFPSRSQPRPSSSVLQAPSTTTVAPFAGALNLVVDSSGGRMTDSSKIFVDASQPATLNNGDYATTFEAILAWRQLPPEHQSASDSKASR